MTTEPDFVDPSVPVHLTKAGVIKDGEPDREWFEESVRRSQRFIELGKREREKELQRILDGKV